MIFDDVSVANESILSAEEQAKVVRAQLALALAGIKLGATPEWRLVREAISDCLTRKGKKLLMLARQAKIDTDRMYKLQGEIAGIEELSSVCDADVDRVNMLKAEEDRLTEELTRLRTSLSQMNNAI
jgi:hypothetical protein